MATQKEFLSRLSILAKVCQFEAMSPGLAELYDRALRGFGYERAIAAVEAAIMERRGNDRMPSVGDLSQRCAPTVSEVDTAVEVSARIWAAIGRFGWNHPTDARDWIGEIGWYVVETNGGWVKLCETAQAKDVGIWKAQLRDHAASAMRRHSAGVLGAAPTFGENKRVNALVGDILKKADINGSSRGDREISRGTPAHRELNAQNDVGVPAKV